MIDKGGAMTPISPDEFPPELRGALRTMSLRGPVVDLATGQRVAEDGHLVTDPEHYATLIPLPEVGRPELPAAKAYLSQVDPALGLRGWEVTVFGWVWSEERETWVESLNVTDRTPLQKPGIRPPTHAQRVEALARIGYEPDDQVGIGGQPYWEWYEGEFVLSGTPYVYAVLTVRKVPAVKS
jgi:hypothetical protein